MSSLEARLRAADSFTPAQDVVREFLPGYVPHPSQPVQQAVPVGSSVSLPASVPSGGSFSLGPPVLASQVSAVGLPRPVAGGCIDRGVDTVLVPSCLSHLAAVPSVISGSSSSIPLPDLSAGGGAGPAALAGMAQRSVVPAIPSGVAPAALDPIMVSARARATGVGAAFAATGSGDGRLSCSISDSGGLVSTLRVADVRSCVVAGTQMLAASYGQFGITMVDGGGSVVAVSCRAYGSAARPVCQTVE